MAERGGVGTRLYVAGGAEVRREFDSTGDAGKRMFSQIAAGEKAASPALKVVSRSVQELRQGVSGLADQSGGVGRVLGALGTGGVIAAAGIGAAVVGMQRFGAAAAQAARDAEELDSAIGFTFGRSADSIRQWGDETGLALGRASTDLQKAAMDFQTLFGPAADEGKAVELSKQFAQLAQDIGSFRNVAADTVAKNLVSGLVGETEPLRKYGVIINAATVETKALEMGLVEAGEEVNDYGKILARAQLILEQTALAQGDLARTSESATNKLVASKSATKELAEDVGQFLNPALSSLAGWWTEVARSISGAIGAYEKWKNSTSTASRFDAESMRRMPGQFGNMARFFMGDPKGSDYSSMAAPDRSFAASSRTYAAPKTTTARARSGAPKDTRSQLTGLDTFQGAVAFDPRTLQDLNAQAIQDRLDREAVGYFEVEKKQVDLSVDIDPARSFQKLNEQIDASSERLHDGVYDALHAAFSGDIGDFIKNKLMSWALEGLTSTLMGGLQSAGSRGGLLGTIANAAIGAFGGSGSVGGGGGGKSGLTANGLHTIKVNPVARYAAGGTEWAGDFTSKGEFGPELSISGRTGQVFDADTTARILGMAGGQGGGGRGGVTVNFAPVIDARGSTPDAVKLLDAKLNQLAAALPDIVDQRAGPAAHDYLQRGHVLPQSY